jgi:hypothetical protein
VKSSSKQMSEPFYGPALCTQPKMPSQAALKFFEEMGLLIDEGRRGLGMHILPFKESKIQLMNARLANLKSTLQLLLQVLQYASSVNVYVQGEAVAKSRYTNG